MVSARRSALAAAVRRGGVDRHDERVGVVVEVGAAVDHVEPQRVVQRSRRLVVRVDEQRHPAVGDATDVPEESSGASLAPERGRDDQLGDVAIVTTDVEDVTDWPVDDGVCGVGGPILGDRDCDPADAEPVCQQVGRRLSERTLEATQCRLV